MKKVQLSTYVTPAIKNRWQQLASGSGTSSSGLLHHVVHQVLDTNPQEAHARTDSDGQGDRIHLRPSAAESAAIANAARRNGLSRQSVLRALVRANLMNQPTPSQAELAALREANRQLAAVGRNLNQLVRKVHTGETSPNGAEQTLFAVGRSMQATQATTQRLVRETLYRWTSRDESDHDTPDH